MGEVDHEDREEEDSIINDHVNESLFHIANRNDYHEQKFEEVMFDGVLDLVFDHLYALPLRVEVFSSGFVNKRWNGVYQHPLQVFAAGHFHPRLKIYPPQYYIQSYGVWCKLRKQKGMRKQIARVTEQDKEQAEFIVKNMFLHSFDCTVECQNKAVKQILHHELMEKRGMKHFSEEEYLAVEEMVTDDAIFLRGLKIFGSTLSSKTRSERLQYRFERDQEFCRLYIEMGFWLKTLPEKFRTPELCLLALSKNPHFGTFRCIPVSCRTQELFNLAVRSDLETFCDRSCDEFKNAELCDYVVGFLGSYLRYVPEHLRTYEMCLKAFFKNPRCLPDIPERCKTAELCRMAVKGHSEGIAYVPPELMTTELCTLHVNTWNRFEPVPMHMRTKALYQVLVEKNPRDNFALVPKDMMDISMCESALKHDGKLLKYVPDQLRTEDILVVAVTSSPGMMETLREEEKSERVCKAAAASKRV